MIKKVFLHIGLHKTASTSIQNSLANSYDRLKNNNFLFPLFYLNNKRIVNHSIPFFSLFTKNPANYSANFNLNITNRKDIEEVHSNYLNQLKEQIKAFKGENLIISGEDISRLTCTQLESLKYFLFDLTNAGIEIEVIAFVRNPVDLVLSLIQEMVKHGEVIDDLFFKAAERVKNRYQSTFSKFIEIFSKESIKVYRLEDAQKHQNGVCGFFVSVIGGSEELQQKVTLFYSNRSITYEGVRFLSAINKKIPFRINGKINPERKTISKADISKFPGQNFFISNADKHLIWKNSQVDLQWLYENFNVYYSAYIKGNNTNRTVFWGKESLLYFDSIIDKQTSKNKKIFLKCLVDEINVQFKNYELKEMIWTLRYFAVLKKRIGTSFFPKGYLYDYFKWFFCLIFCHLRNIFK
ncbi:MAG: hypothetical protein K9H26_16070 [Prolixibacteraceae bacterium]|nr:hypothetical protein [Prolixibacteraceae bacterium]